MENYKESSGENNFQMELITKSGKKIGDGIVKIEKTFLCAQFCNKIQRKYFEFKISLKDLLAVKEVGAKSDYLILEVYYIKYKLQRVLSLENIRLRSTSQQAICFHKMINDIIQGFSRPKRLVVFINPISGRKKGFKIYREHMAPLCKLCGIECDVIVTNRRGQALEILDSYDLSQMDGIVTVGGDGIFSECVNGLLRRYQTENNINIHDIDSRLLPCELPIGMIPAGSGNVLIEFLHGNKDVQTSVLRIILGDVTRTNVAGVHQDGVLSVYACLVLGFGLCGRMVRDCEKTRWMGPSRYSVAPLKSLLTRKSYDVEVSPLIRKTEVFHKPTHRNIMRTKSYDQNGMPEVSDSRGHLFFGRSKSLDHSRLSFSANTNHRGRRSVKRACVSPKHSQPSSFKRRGNVLLKSADGFVMSDHRKSLKTSARHKTMISPVNGNIHKTFPDFEHHSVETPISEIVNDDTTLRDRVYSVDTWIPTLTDTNGRCVPVFGDTKLTAYSVRPCSFSDHLKHLLKVNSRVAYCFKFDFVHSLRGRGYKVRIFPDRDSGRRNKYYLNYDGDALLLKSTEFEVRLHRNIVKLFGTIEEKELPNGDAKWQ